MLNNKGTNIFWQKFKAGKNSGQVAILGVLIIALILLFTLVTENVGRYALIRTRVDNATDGAALGLISNMASWATYLSRTYLGWDDEECMFVATRLFSWIWLVVAVFVPGLQWTIPFAGATLAGTYIQAAELGRTQTRQFKKMSKNLQFKESARSDAFFRLVDDAQVVDDIHDWDGDGSTTDKIARSQAWINYRYIALSLDGEAALIKAFRWFLKLLSGYRFEGLNGEWFCCDAEDGYTGYSCSGAFDPGWVPNFINNDFNSWIAPGGLFEVIESGTHVGGPYDTFELDFWQPDTAANPYPNDKIDKAIEEMTAFINFVKNDVLGLVDHDLEEIFNGNYYSDCAIELAIEKEHLPLTSSNEVIRDYVMPHAEGILNQLYVPEHYDRDANGNYIFYDEDGIKIDPTVDYYDKAFGWTDPFDGTYHRGWKGKIQQWYEEIELIPRYFLVSCMSESCDPRHWDPDDCQACLGNPSVYWDIASSMRAERIFSKLDQLAEYTYALTDVIYNTAGNDAKPSLATSFAEMQAKQATKKFYYSWPVKIRTYNSAEDPDDDGYKVIWRHIKIDNPHFPSKVPYLEYDAGILNDCVKLKRAKEYVSLRVKYYTPDIPIFYVRGANNPLQLLWKIRTRKQAQNEVDDEFNQIATDLTGDGVIGYEDLIIADPGAEAKIDTLLNDYGIISHAGGWFNWRMYNNQLQDIFE